MSNEPMIRGGGLGAWRSLDLAAEAKTDGPLLSHSRALYRIFIYV